MKFAYTLLVAFLIAFTASAQTATIVSESFAGPNYAFTWSGDWGTSATAPLSNTATPEPGSGGNYLMVTNGSAVTSTLSFQVSTVGRNNVVVSWYERSTGSNTNKPLTRSFEYTVGTTTATLVPTTTVISESWTKFSVTLGANANFANSVTLTWTTTSQAGNVKYAIDDVVVRANSPSLTTSVSNLTFSAEAPGKAVVKQYTLSGSNLTSNVVISAPSRFEVSLDNVTFSENVSVAPVSGSIGSRTIYVKYVSYDAGKHTGNLTHVTTGTSQMVALEGTTDAVSASPLPVELASFEAKSQNGKVSLSWTTATEKNNEKFVVERSLDGKNFSKLGEVAGKGTSSVKVAYRFTDAVPAQGTNYYRLRQLDFDGTESFSQVVAIETIVKTAQVTVYPTVVSETVTISLSEAGNSIISILDAAGKPVVTFDMVTIQELELPVYNFKSGVYFVKIVNSQGQQVQRFIKK